MQFDRHRLILAAAVGLGLAGSAFAQQATTPAPDAGTTPAAEAPAPAQPAAGAAATPAPADAGQPGDGNPAAQEQPREIVRETFGDWQVRCTPLGNECFMYQLARDSNKNPVAEISLLKLPKGGEAVAGMTVVSPLGTLLTSGVGVLVDNNQLGRYPFNWCSQIGCFARIGLNDQSVATLKHGKAGEMALVSISAPDHPLVLNLSLTGFTAAYDSLEVPTPPPGAPAALPSLAPANPAPLAPANPAPLAPKQP